MGKPRIEIGRKYVVQVKTQNQVDLLREYTRRELFVFEFLGYVKSFFKVIAILVSVLFPPLLLITIPLLKTKDKE